MLLWNHKEYEVGRASSRCGGEEKFVLFILGSGIPRVVGGFNPPPRKNSWVRHWFLVWPGMCHLAAASMAVSTLHVITESALTWPWFVFLRQYSLQCRDDWWLKYRKGFGGNWWWPGRGATSEFAGKNWYETRKTTFRAACAPVEIRTRHLQNRIQSDTATPVCSEENKYCVSLWEWLFCLRRFLLIQGIKVHRNLIISISASSFTDLIYQVSLIIIIIILTYLLTYSM
jgi:hypothetical protein